MFQRLTQLIVLAMFVITCACLTNVTSGDEPKADESKVDGPKAKDTKKSKFKDFKEVTKDATIHDGLFKLYQKDEHLYAEIKPNQFDQLLIAPMAIARGVASAGTPLNSGDEWILLFHLAGDKVQLIRKNIRYEAPKDTPLARAVEQNYTDSILMTLPIVTKNPAGQGTLINLSKVFLTNFARLPYGSADPSRTRWHKIKAYKKNIELQVEMTFRGQGARGYGYDDGVIDSRGITVVVHYSLCQRPEKGYKPRLADSRVGHFLNATKDFGSSDPYTTFVRRINRWRIEKANPDAELSPPKQQLVWWVENTVPHEYRPYVEAGILEWNKAFERIGFRNAIGVRWQNDGDEFDAEDINYCTFRWITTPNTFAMSGLRSDPITGEMIDGDVIFDASWIRAWKNEYALLVGAPAATDQDAMAASQVLDVGEVISPMLAAKRGFGLPQGARQMFRAAGIDTSDQHLVPATQSPIQRMLGDRLGPANFASCQCAVAKRHEYTLAAMVIASRDRQDEDNDAKNGDEKDEEEDDDDDEQDENDKEQEKQLELPEEFIGQAIKEVVMHEVGHSLGLRHNFKASTMLSLEEVNDPEITRERGMVGSVMDYSPLNIAPAGEQQGDYAMTTIGPYDYWAIEYAYKPIKGNEEAELTKIAARSPEPDLVFATDEDLYLANDPLVNTYDLGDDPLAYVKQRVEIAGELLDDIDEVVVRDGESWARLRSAFSVLLSQFGNAAYVASAHIGGEHVARDFKGDENAREPVTPVAGDKQREALEFLTKGLFTDEPYQFSPQLLRRMTVENWSHWGIGPGQLGSSGLNLHNRILSIQRIGLNHCLSANVLQRLQNQALMFDDPDEPLGMDEVFRALTECIWSELDTKSKEICCSTIRRNLQREHLSRLANIAIGSNNRNSGFDFIIFSSAGRNYPPDARSLARMHLKEIKTLIESALSDKKKPDDATRAHLDECQDQIAKVLDATMATARP